MGELPEDRHRGCERTHDLVGMLSGNVRVNDWKTDLVRIGLQHLLPNFIAG